MNYFVFFYRDIMNYLRKHNNGVGYNNLVHMLNFSRVIPMDLFNSDILMYCSDDLIKQTGIKNNLQCLHYLNPIIRNIDSRNSYSVYEGNAPAIMFVNNELFINHFLETILDHADKNIIEYFKSIMDGIDVDNTYQIKSGIVNSEFKFCLEINHEVIDLDEYDKSIPSFNFLFKHKQNEDYWYEIQNATRDYYFVMKISDRNLKILKMTSQWDILSNVILEKYTNNIIKFIHDYQQWSDFPYKQYLYKRLTQ